MALLDVQDLSIDIGGIKPLDSIGFAVDKGETLGIVGESGSGKSLTALSIMGLLPLIGGRVERGSIRFDGMELTRLPEPDYRRLRGRRIAFITQNPMTSLDPVIRVGEQIDQVARLHLGLSGSAARRHSIEIMERLRIPEAATTYHNYPHQLSGGMKQRIVIAMALAANPDLIIADEPTTALDVTIQAQIVQILGELVREKGVALILITHDMGVVAQACDRVVVLYAGRVAESNTVSAIFASPRHPYTQALIGCIPRNAMERGSLVGIPGLVPSVARYPAGCRFHPRCTRSESLCEREVPVLERLASGAEIACHVADKHEAAHA
ncbi:ABC transporter ATP-binding protein [Aestuariivirga sp. YIM B02566]|uniref:ABC transporter ATP-binding protein n=1 Tax=Taklimakanibacter albus TaxID=2800327 RepID=A0ACC5R9Y9_9HYPH|nr:ABC transporter ATP-binding protein [Aestuariivirga sp. YIM B02566]MBK1869433.1 ABC transporter ATP-binding protein [Aestuariivirga sp. YIM B02566]